jgi:hypothetical protein
MSHNLYKVKDHDDLIKDRSSGAVLFSDKTVADDYRAKKAMLQKNRDMSTEINSLKEKVAKIDHLESDLKDIKELLQRIVNK